MFVCPTCGEEFNKEENIRTHFLQCWNEKHPYHKSKDASRSEDKVTRVVNEDIMNFFKGLN